MDKNTKNYLIVGVVLLLVYFLYNKSKNNNEHYKRAKGRACTYSSQCRRRCVNKKCT